MTVLSSRGRKNMYLVAELIVPWTVGTILWTHKTPMKLTIKRT